MSERSQSPGSSLRGLIDAPLTVFDIGAAGTFRELPRLAPLCVLHTFEPRADAAIHRHEVALAGAAGTRELFVTINGNASSMLRPNQLIIDRWAAERPEEVSGFDLARTDTIECTTLDAIAAQNRIGAVDYMKVDTQGTELEILLGDERTLQNTSIIRSEVEFVELYEQQPLFDDMVRELSGRGFRFVNFGYGQKVGDKRIWSDGVFARRSLAGKQAVKAALSCWTSATRPTRYGSCGTPESMLGRSSKYVKSCRCVLETSPGRFVTSCDF